MLHVLFPLQKLKSNTSGGTSIIFALVLTAIMLIIGLMFSSRGSINVKNDGQHAIDSATLTLLRTYILTGDETVAREEAIKAFEANADSVNWDLELGRLVERDGEFVVDATAYATVESGLPNMMEPDAVRVSIKSESAIPIRNLSAVVVPDVSYSMNGSHIAAVKDAMEVFAEEMYALPRAITDRMTMSIVPYAGSVNVSGGSNRVTSLLRSWSYASPHDYDFTHKRHYKSGAACSAQIRDRHDERLIRSGNNARYEVTRHSWEDRIVEEGEWREDEDGNSYWHVTNRRTVWECVNKGVQRTQNWSGCLQTTQAEFDVSRTLNPNGSDPIPPSVHRGSIPHCPASTSTMKTNIRSEHEFKRHARGMTLGWATAHDIGLLWAARIMEPRWSSFFSLTQQPWNDEQFPKYLIFLSDGASVKIGYEFGEYPGRNASVINQNVQALCSFLKNNGVTIYGISYSRQNRPDALQVVEDCASEDKHFTGMDSNIDEIFKDIAFEIKSKELRLSR